MVWIGRFGLGRSLSFLCFPFALLFTPAVWLRDSLLLLLYMYVWEDDRSTDGVYAMQCRVANDYGLYMIRVVRSIMIDHGLLSESESLTRVRRSCSCIEFCGPCRLLSK